MEILNMMLMFLAVAAVSFGLFYVALRSENESATDVLENKDKAAFKELKKELKNQPTTWHSVVMSKWMSFGGGFYGVMAVLTYLVVEFKEVVDFLTNDNDFLNTISNLGISDLVNFFINSLMNFITAISWPAYWIGKTERASIWVWFFVIYGGYVFGQMAAKWVNNEALYD